MHTDMFHNINFWKYIAIIPYRRRKPVYHP